MTTALTLSDYIASPKPLLSLVAKILHETSRFMSVLPFKDIGAMSAEAWREGNVLPNVGWRDIGADHGSVVAVKPDKVTEQVYSIGNEIIVDKMYARDSSTRLVDPMTYQTNMITKAIARNFNNIAINGLPADLKNPVGLWHRTLYDLGSSQRINASVDISPDAASLSTGIQTMIDKLDELLYAVNDNIEIGGSGVYLLCNSTTLFRLNSIFRQSGLVSESKDALGRIWMEYKGAKFIDMGLKYDESTKVIGNVESGTALTGGAATSIYAVKVGEEYFTGIQEYGLEVSDFELMDDKVTYKSVIDWAVGLALVHPRSVARLYGITAA